MTTIRLAANLIAKSAGLGWGHFQIVNSSTGFEIEVQSWANPAPGDPSSAPYFQYNLPRPHSDFTDFSPGSVNFDPFNYAIADIDIGTRDADAVWAVLTKVNFVFYNDHPLFLYDLFQNSNSYANTLLWMIGIDLSGYIGAATPSSVLSFPGAGNNILVGSSSEISFDLTLTSTADFLRTVSGDDVVSGGEGNDSIFGGDGDDDIFGGGGHDLLDGAGSYAVWVGANALYGGDGNDEIFFYAEGGAVDLIRGGSGFDTGRFVPRPSFDTMTPLTVDMSETEIEVLVAGAGYDDITTAGETLRMISGGSGNDTFNITTNSGSPTIIWGGDGADTINLAAGVNSPEGAAGILVVNVAGLTEENFHLFDIEQLGLGANFDWGQIDAILINPDATDRVMIEGNLLQAQQETQTIGGQYYVLNGEPHNPNNYEVRDEVITTLTSLQDYSGGIIGTYSVGFLGSGPRSVIAAAARYTYIGITVQLDENGEPVTTSTDESGNETLFPWTDYFDIDNAEFVSADWTSPPAEGALSRTYYFSVGNYLASPGGGLPSGTIVIPTEGGGEPQYYYEGVSSIASLGTFVDPISIGTWFIFGGNLNSAVISDDGSITYTMPDPEEGSGSGGGGGTGGGGTGGGGSSGGGGPSLPRGGSYHDSSGASNLNGGEGTRRLNNFNASQDTIVIKGIALNGSNLPSGMTAYEASGSTVISYGSDDYVVLRGVTLAQWQAGAAGQILGGAGADSLTGTSGANVFAGGGGADTISAGAGNDRINYASGDDVILGHLSNAGSDTLDLRRFTARDVTFRVSGQDVLVNTADGTIRLGSQIQYDLGNARSNIETILFVNGSLNEGDIRARAVSDQSTTGNDSITGTAFADAINGLAGNDTINASSGNDTIMFSAGNDVILGHLSNAGADTLDLRQYATSGVSFRVSGQDVLITTADGTITLGSQLQYAVGNARSNIETILFSNGSLTEAGIMARAVSDQATSGNDIIIGTAFADVINGLGGSDTMTGFAGDDTFGFTSGDDVILGNLSNFGTDMLDLRQFSASNATFRVSGVDVLVTTSSGTIRLGSQVQYATGHERSNIETILFSNGTLNEAAIRARAIADQATAGANTITGTGQADIIRGLAGNDTITGGAGADIFVFARGDGADRITDFSRSGGDVIRFYGLTYNDLTISQLGSNAVVNYGSGNILTLASVTASTLTAAAFEFL